MPTKPKTETPIETYSEPEIYIALAQLKKEGTKNPHVKSICRRARENRTLPAFTRAEMVAFAQTQNWGANERTLERWEASQGE